MYNEKQFKEHAFCLLCKMDVYYGASHATSNLKKHVDRHHKEVYKAILSERAKKRQSIVPAQGDSQRSLDHFLKVPSYEDCLIRWMIQTYQSYKLSKKIRLRK